MSGNNIVNRIRIPGMPQVIPLLTVMMEVFWIYTWLLWLSTIPALRWNTTPLNLVSCLVLGILVEIFVRLTITGQWSLKRVRLTILPFSFLFLFLLVRLNLGGGYSIGDP